MIKRLGAKANHFHYAAAAQYYFEKGQQSGNISDKKKWYEKMKSQYTQLGQKKEVESEFYGYAGNHFYRAGLDSKDLNKLRFFKKAITFYNKIPSCFPFLLNPWLLVSKALAEASVETSELTDESEVPLLETVMESSEKYESLSD